MVKNIESTDEKEYLEQVDANAVHLHAYARTKLLNLLQEF